jgi:hypothetical protein
VRFLLLSSSPLDLSLPLCEDELLPRRCVLFDRDLKGRFSGLANPRDSNSIGRLPHGG